MALVTLDWLVIGSFLLLTLGIGLYFRKQASQGIESFFLGGRNLPWYIAGTSMVATTFAADTPLAVTELVAQYGIAGNWLWWNMLIGGMLTTFFFAKYWRRAGILTDMEFLELRYSGREASFLRGFKAIYLGMFMNALVIGWVNLALMSLLEVFFGIAPADQLIYIGLAMVLVVAYSSVSGLLGVAFTDVVQFVLAMGGCIILAYLVINDSEIGSVQNLTERLPDWSLQFFPNVGGMSAGELGTALTVSLGSFLAIIGLQWWASWYPGNEPGGGGYIAQRMMSAKDEKNAVYATLFFQIAHYALRPWPWIIVALAAAVLYPDLEPSQQRLGYVYAMRDYLPDGLRGLLLVAFFAAYMSTISTQLNWGTSYLINDVYKRFIRPEASEKQLVMASRIGTGLLMLFALLITSMLETIAGVWEFLIEAGAGVGLVLIMRWLWWRVNAWSEITATLTPVLAYALARYGFGWNAGLLEDPTRFVFVISVTTISWLAVTYLTQPTRPEVLQHFYARVKPLGAWAPFRATGEAPSGPVLLKLLICWLSAVIMAYSILFFIGYALLRNGSAAGISALAAIIAFAVLKYFSARVRIFEDEPENRPYAASR